MRIMLGFVAGLLGSVSVAAAQLAPVPPLASPAFRASDLAATEDGGATAGVVSVRLLVGRSTLVDVGVPITRVSLTSSDVADALVTAPDQLLVHGKVPGTISMFVWDRGGIVRRYEVTVQRDLARLDEQVAQLFPGEPVQVHSNGRHVVLSGRVSSQELADRMVSLAAGYVENREDVLSLLQVQETGTQQVLLRVRFAEVSRSALSELGASFFTSPTGVENTLGRVTTQQFAAPSYEQLQWSKADSSFGSPVTSASGEINFSDFLNLFLFSQRYDLGVVIRALQQRGLFQSLAEPNLVAESGKEASFLAGGEFPVPIAQGTGNNAAVTVDYKEFGIRLNFTPTVVGADRVHLKVRPEVSTLDYGNAVVLNGFRIPALITRRTETELELRHGQTFAIAGLMNNQLSSTMQQVPILGDIPILGYLFRSRAAQKEQTELVVMITPEIVSTSSPGAAPSLPRYPEPFLDPLPADRTMPAPPPAFSSERMAPSQGTVTAGAGDGQAPSAAPAAGVLGAEAGAAQQGQSVRLSARELQQVERRQREEQERLERVAIEEARREAEAAERTRREEERARQEAERRAAAEARDRERQAREEAERARREEERARQEAERRAAAEARDRERQAREEAERDQRETGAVDREAERRAVEAARRAAEQARLANEAAPQSDDRDAARRRALEEAERRLPAAEAEYRSEVERTANPD